MERIFAKDAPTAVGPFSHAMLSNGFFYCSGQVAINEEQFGMHKPARTTVAVAGSPFGAIIESALQNTKINHEKLEIGSLWTYKYLIQVF
jgi:enamine deaminase RidA (YjgF/YER057c/UK114 family)